MRLDLVVGPNGAGKSTLVDRFIEPRRPGVPFVNADTIAAARWPQDPVSHSYEAAEAAARARQGYLQRGEPFIAETVFSHPSKLDLVRAARAGGFHVTLWVVLIPVEVTVSRVRTRVRNGGHHVPEDKIRERFARLWALVAEAVLLVDVSHFFANDGPAPEYLGGFADGLRLGALEWPSWVHPDLPQKLGGTVKG
jgi:predicted ABC-type ATPase